MKPVRVIVCDDMPYIREYFSEIINSCGDMCVVGTAADGRTAVELAKETVPDVVLMDIQMESERDGVEATERIRALLPDVKVVAVTVHEDEEYIVQAFLAGASDYVVKTECNEEELCRMIREVHSGQVVMRSRVAKAVLKEFTSLHARNVSLLYFVNMLTDLTPTEIAVLKDLYAGKTRAQIARERYVEPATVKFHIHNILRKLKYRSTRPLLADLKKIGFFENTQA